MKKKVLISALVLFLVGNLMVFSACSKDEGTSAKVKTRVLKLGHKTTESHSWHKGSLLFADLVKEGTKGEIVVEIYPNSQLGDQKQMTEAAQIGVLDFLLGAPAEFVSFIPQIGVLDLPFLFRDYDHAFKALDTVGLEYDNYFQAKNLKLLSTWNTGFKSLSNSKKEIKSIADIKGMKIRVAGNPMLIEVVRAMGANAITIPWSETYIALQQGTADSQFNPPGPIVDNKIHEVQKYFSPNLVIQYGAEQFVISMNTWKSLTEEQQKIILDAADKAKEYQRKESLLEEKRALQVMKDYGCVVSDVPQEVVNELIELLTPVLEKNGDPVMIKKLRDVQ